MFFISNLCRPIRPWRDLKALFELVRLLRIERPHIVHTHSSKAGVIGRLAAWLAGVPIRVHTVHGFGFNPAQPFWVRLIYVWLERLLALRTTTLVFVSNANRNEAVARRIGNPEKQALIRAAVHLEDHLSLVHTRAAPEKIFLSPDDRLVITVGPFKPQKNLLDFVRAAQKAVQRCERVRFLVVGDGVGRNELESEIACLNLSDKIILAGWRSDVPNLLARADIFCMTSLWEGLPMALVEAMAAGLPCVVNAVDGCRDVVENGVTGFLTQPGNHQETADKIIYLLDHPEEARALGQRARESVGPEFACARMIEQHETLYERLLGFVNK
jgi:glycosyltransferase involved in cell wall biosynthesis